MAGLRGDPVLVEQLRFGQSLGDLDSLLSRAARCWDRYALPDGTRNPGRGRAGDEHWVYRPTEKIVNDALDNLLRKILDPADRWLLDIPRVLVPDRTSAQVLMSRKGAAIGMPWSAFGGLFYANALRTMFYFAEDDPSPADRSWRAGRQRRRLARHLPSGLCANAVRNWFTGIKVPAESAAAAVRLEGVVTVWMKRTAHETAAEIWQVTVFQQALMTLHEFGHLVAFKNGPAAGSGVTAIRCGLAEELGADLWSRRYLERLARAFFGGGPEVVVPLLDLFGVLDLVGFADPADRRRADLAVRCADLVNGLVAKVAHPEAVLAKFDRVRSLYDKPEEMLLGDFRYFDDLLGPMDFGYGDERARAEFEPLTKRWT